MFLKAIAQETLKIIRAGKLTTAAGTAIDFLAEQQAAETGTTLYTPEQIAQLLKQARSKSQSKLTVIEVTLDYFFLASVITAPAPNAGQVLRRNPQASSEIESALRRRAGYVLTVARDRGHRSLLLGGWGCGVFRNDPQLVADAFDRWLNAPEFEGCFDRVVFGVCDCSRTKAVLTAFQDRFIA